MINDLTAISKIQSAQSQNPLGTQAQQEIAKPKPAQDSFALSPEAKRLMQSSKSDTKAQSTPINKASQEIDDKKPTQLLDAKTAKEQLKNLSAEEQLQLTRLQTRDTEVRAHEQAHVAAGGGLTGKPSYTEQQGPDGKMYAIGGQVSIDMSEAETPEKTLEKARIIKAAALAPAQPSAEDRRIAAYAEQMAAQASVEMEKMRMQTQSTATQPQATDAKPQIANTEQKTASATAPKLQPGFSLKA